MPLYRNPDFQRLPSGLARLFDTAADGSFFALPAWFDLMMRCGSPPGTEIHLYTDEQPSPAIALLFQTAACGPGRRLVSLANAYSVEHDILYRSGADLDAGLDAIFAEILAERPRWDCLSLTELDPRQPSYRSAVQALRRAGLLVECRFHSGTWYEDTEALSFADYVAARPSELRNTWRRKRRRVERGGRLTKAFFADTTGINEAIIDYQTIYAASWKPPEDFPQLIPALIRLAAEFGALRLGIYYIDGQPAAAQFWILWHGRAVIYNGAKTVRYLLRHF